MTPAEELAQAQQDLAVARLAISAILCAVGHPVFVSHDDEQAARHVKVQASAALGQNGTLLYLSHPDPQQSAQADVLLQGRVG